MIPRYYQREAIDAQEFAWSEFNRTIIKMPTGAGKSFTSVKIASNGLPERTLYLADQDELCAQPIQAFKRGAGIYVSVERAKEKASLEAQVVVGSAQSLSRKKRRERFPRDHFSRIIVDEAHRGTDRDISICDYFETAKVCGMTATPFRQNLADLSKWYDTVAYKMEPINFIQAGFAPEESIFTMPVEIDLRNVKSSKSFGETDYSKEDAEHAITPYFDVIADMVRQHARGRFGIAYLPLIATSKEFAACLRRHGITAQHIDGTSDDRDEIIERFKRREFSWLCNSGVISTGVDIPIADAFLCLRPTRSAAWYQQARGRVWRVLPGVIDDLPEKEQAEERRERILWSDKPNSLIFDLLWQNDELGVQRPGDMYAESQYDARQIFEKTKGQTDPLMAMEIAKRVQEDRENAVIKALERAAFKTQSDHVQADHVGAILGDFRLSMYSPVSAWEMKPVTEPQKTALHNLGVNPETVKGFGQARMILDTLHFRIRMKFCSLKQCRIIKSYNEKIPEVLRVRNPEMLTMEEASREISKIRGK